jgi:RNA polymerase sigma factor (sigma-70 family)
MAQAGSTHPPSAQTASGSGAGGEGTALLQRIARGDQSAVSEFMKRYSALVWSLARRLAANDPDAEDAVHEIFIDLWKSAARFDPAVASEVTFVAMIARRRLIDRRRRLGRIPRMEAVRDDDVSRAASAGGTGPGVDGASGNDMSRTAEGAVQTSEEARRAALELKNLSLDQQKVLRLSIFHGLSHEKISSALSMPLGTVKTHARRGLIRLRESLEGVRAKSRTGNPAI